MSKETQIAQRFLESISQEPTKDTFTTLTDLIEVLENKDDPSPVEIRIVESLYHFIEKLKVLENNLRSYVKDDNKNLNGNKLSDLYESNTGYGSSKFFE